MRERITWSKSREDKIKKQAFSTMKEQFLSFPEQWEMARAILQEHKQQLFPKGNIVYCQDTAISVAFFVFSCENIEKENQLNTFYIHMWQSAYLNAIRSQIATIVREGRRNVPPYESELRGPGFDQIELNQLAFYCEQSDAASIGVTVKENHLCPDQSCVGSIYFSDAPQAFKGNQIGCATCRSTRKNCNLCIFGQYKKKEEIMKITFMPMNRKEEFHQNETILESARRAGVVIETACASNGKCGKCKVLLMKGEASPLTKEEQKLLTDEEIKRGIRLACQVRGKSDLVVMVLTSQKIESTVVIEEAAVNTSLKNLGVAMDIGTTTIEMRLYDLDKKICLIKGTQMNPQRRFGADVIARIAYGMGSEKHVKEMRQCLIDSCNQMLRDMLAKIEADEESIKHYVAAGNTTMGHILAGLTVDSLGKAPIKPVCYEYNEIRCSEIGLIGEETATLQLLANIGGHVGGDTTAGLITAQFFHEKGNYLFLDVGTNGEIALCKDGKVYVCSTAAGPAFEGASLTHGMCAATGAITHAAIYHGKPVVEVLGNGKPAGITGSGIIDAVANMLKAHIVDASGLLSEEYRMKGYPLYEDKEGTSSIFVSQDDIRQIQLAKGAIAAGISLMMREADLNISDLDLCYIAGTFGSHLNIVNAMTVGLIPRLPVSKVTYLGNASCEGAASILLGNHTKEEVNGFLAEVVHLDLANEPEFQNLFVENLNF